MLAYKSGSFDDFEKAIARLGVEQVHGSPDLLNEVMAQHKTLRSQYRLASEALDLFFHNCICTIKDAV